MGPLHQALKQPMTAELIDHWEGATTLEQQALTLALFDAVTAEDLACVHRLIGLGASVNAKRQFVKGVEAMRSPLELALWMVTHDADTDAIVLNFTQRPDGRFASNGIAEALIEAGAVTWFSPTGIFSKPMEGHPVFDAMESMVFDQWLTGKSPKKHKFMSKEARRESPYQVPAFSRNGKNDELWLHRAIVHERWDVVGAWLSRGAILNARDTASACALVASTFFSKRQEPMLSLEQRRFFDQVRPVLVAEDDDAFRFEIVALARTLMFYSEAEPTLEGWQFLNTWARDVLLERPLLDFALTEQEANASTQSNAVQRWLKAIESQALSQMVDDTVPLACEPRRRRL